MKPQTPTNCVHIVHSVPQPRPWPSPYDMRASYYACYTRPSEGPRSALPPISPWTGPEPKSCPRPFWRLIPQAYFQEDLLLVLQGVCLLQLIFLSPAILEEKPAWRMVSSFLSLRDASLVHAVSRGRLLLPSWWCFLTWHLGGWALCRY